MTITQKLYILIAAVILKNNPDATNAAILHSDHENFSLYENRGQQSADVSKEDKTNASIMALLVSLIVGAAVAVSGLMLARRIRSSFSVP